ncbi:MAG: molybdate ABC transporter substrate-binding protein [Desulfuromonadales bacterium]|nr:molybdate ABC transporter substrate-binding protein [Desulfuromonadales bacterium]
MRPFILKIFILTLLLFTALAPIAAGAEIRLFVTASMTDAAKELIATYRQQFEAVDFLPNFAASGLLAKQIAQGAPADIYISANPGWMNYLVEEGVIGTDRVQIFAYNSLVFVGKKGVTLNALADLTRLERIALGSPKSVPAGQYAEQALQAAGLYAKLQGKLVLAKDVRQALIYADRGETDGAFVYKTDARLAQNAVILLEVPQELYSEVTYPVGLTSEGAKNPAALKFFTFLKSAAATKILRKYGFVVR